MINRQPIVITGMGIICSVGMNVDEFWKSLAAGKSGIGKITRFDVTDFPAQVAAEVKDFNPVNYMDAKTVDRTSRTVQMGIAATKEAMESARLDINKVDKTRVGVVTTTMIDADYLINGSEVLREKGPRRVDPLFIVKGGPHSVSQQVGTFVGGTGPNTSVNSVCASGSDAIGVATNFIRLGYADVMVAGGSDCSIGPGTLAGLVRLGALSKATDPALACRPFDLNRNGFVAGEGAAIVILETLDHARKRGAPILAELAGAGWSFDAASVTAPQAETQVLAIQSAMRNAGIKPEDIDCINCHGTGTRLNDKCETAAIKMALGERAYQIPISSNKSMFGHGITAGGALEFVSAVSTITNNFVPPTINYETPDPECDLDCVPNVGRQAEINTILSNEFGIGGENVCLIIRRFVDK
ncbi:beta-ketoacyl-[acyl-carrier-protein] synthase family protein [Chloroflexota bacterium]